MSSWASQLNQPFSVSRDPETSDPLISEFSLIEIYGGCAPMRLRWSVEITMQHGNASARGRPS